MSKRQLSRKKLKRSIYFSAGIGFSTIGIGLSVSIPVYYSIKNSLAKTKNDVVNLSRYILDLAKQLGVDPDDLVKDLAGGYKVVFSKGRVRIFQKKGTKKVLVMHTNGDGTSGYASSVSGGAGKVLLGVLKKIATTLGKNSEGAKDVLKPFLDKSKDTSLATEAAVTGKSKQDIMLRNALGGGDSEYEKLKKDIAAGKTGIASVDKTGATFMKAYKKNEKAKKAALQTQAKTKAKNANALSAAIKKQGKSGSKKPIVIPASLKAQQKQQVLAAQAKLKQLYIDTISAFYKFAKGKKINWSSTAIDALEIKRLKEILKFATEADLRVHLNSSAVSMASLEKDYKLTRTAYTLLVVAIKAQKKLAAAEMKAAAKNKNVLRNIANNPVSLATALARSFGYENPDRTKSKTDITSSKNIRNNLILEAKKGGMKAGDLRVLISSIKDLIGFDPNKNLGTREITFNLSSISITSGQHQFFLLKAISNDPNFISTFIMFDSRRHKRNDYKIIAIDSSFSVDHERINSDMSILIKDFFLTNNTNEKKHILQMLFDLDKNHIPTLGPLYDFLWKSNQTFASKGLNTIKVFKSLRKILLLNRRILRVESSTDLVNALQSGVGNYIKSLSATSNKFARYNPADKADDFELFLKDNLLDEHKSIAWIKKILDNLADHYKTKMSGTATATVLDNILREREIKALQLDIPVKDYFEKVFSVESKNLVYTFGRVAAHTDGRSYYDRFQDLIDNFERDVNGVKYHNMSKWNVSFRKFPQTMSSRSGVVNLNFGKDAWGSSVIAPWYDNMALLSSKVTAGTGHIWFGGLIKPALPAKLKDQKITFLMPLFKLPKFSAGMTAVGFRIVATEDYSVPSPTSTTVSDSATSWIVQSIRKITRKGVKQKVNLNGDSFMTFTEPWTNNLIDPSEASAAQTAGNQLFDLYKKNRKFSDNEMWAFSAEQDSTTGEYYTKRHFVSGTQTFGVWNPVIEIGNPGQNGTKIQPIVVMVNGEYYVMLKVMWWFKGINPNRTLFIKNLDAMVDGAPTNARDLIAELKKRY